MNAGIVGRMLPGSFCRIVESLPAAQKTRLHGGECEHQLSQSRGVSHVVSGLRVITQRQHQRIESDLAGELCDAEPGQGIGQHEFGDDPVAVHHPDSGDISVRTSLPQETRNERPMTGMAVQQTGHRVGHSALTFRVGQDDLVVGRIHSDDQRWIGRLRRVRELQSPSDRLRCEPGVFTQSRVQNDDVRRRLRRRSKRWGTERRPVPDRRSRQQDSC